VRFIYFQPVVAGQPRQTADVLAAMLRLPPNRSPARDRALLALGFAGAFQPQR